MVTGSGHGLGRECALLLARRGDHVVVNDLAEDSAAAVADEIARFGGSAVAVVSSVATEDGVAAIVDAALTSFGAVDAVVSNAGVFRQIDLEDESVEGFRSMLDVHLMGAFLLAKHCWPSLRDSAQGGRFIGLVSGAGLYGQSRMHAYAAAKGALAGFLRTLALDGSPHGVYVNGVAPVAQTGTPRTVEGQALASLLGDRRGPEWAAPIIAHLASPACGVTGRFYTAGAGRIARVGAAEAKGWTIASETPPSVMDIESNWAVIDAMEEMSFPERVEDSIAVLKRELESTMSRAD